MKVRSGEISKGLVDGGVEFDIEVRFREKDREGKKKAAGVQKKNQYMTSKGYYRLALFRFYSLLYIYKSNGLFSMYPTCLSLLCCVLSKLGQKGCEAT